MAKKYQHHKFPPCLGFPSMGERTRRILHTFSDITYFSLLYIEIGVFYLILYVAGSCKQYGEKKKTGKFLVDFPAFLDKLT